ncbi:hypothetical protein [Pseudofrankia sp. BMG5.37]|uniref:hypothetical protein n=1 Tax=Pseudofrankia sp. BMG5.37 TaxID=3050035 RepID=UPI0028951654|nr:hypothetical protein [Pseudofrankia sp. BMG5.37]MDT3442869.1 hypothetical protein [Pseudofrankia sp. BMG5.37]
MSTEGEPTTMLAAPATAVPDGSPGAGPLTREHVSGWTGWAASLGALASGLAVAALLLALVVMHAGLAPAMAGHSAMTAGGGGVSAVTMPGHLSIDEAASMTGAAMARPADGNLATGLAASAMAAAAAPGETGAGGMPGHVGGVMCLAVLTLVALSLAVPFLRRIGRGPAGQVGGLMSPGMRAGWAADRPPRPAAALARLCVLRT